MLADQKRIEALYLNEAIKACSIFPAGEIEENEQPDFLLKSNDRIIGIEITELCEEKARSLGVKFRKIPENAKVKYFKKDQAYSVDVHAAFSPDAESINHDLSDDLAKFVYKNRHLTGNITENLPSGYCCIGIWPPQEPETEGIWRGYHAFGGKTLTKELLEKRINEKNTKLKNYKNFNETWLLIINDQFLGHGEVYPKQEDLRQWTFDFEYQKVLLFMRSAGSNGKVFEIVRTP